MSSGHMHATTHSNPGHVMYNYIDINSIPCAISCILMSTMDKEKLIPAVLFQVHILRRVRIIFIYSVVSKCSACVHI